MNCKCQAKPKAIKYANQIAWDRRAQGLLLSPLRRRPAVSSMNAIAADLRHRRRLSKDGGKALVRWLAIDCSAIPTWVTTIEVAIDQLYLCPEHRLRQLAQTLRVAS